MAVRWRCPSCSMATIEPDPLRQDEYLVCSSCEARVSREETLCLVCDSPGPLRPRGTVHVQCRVCGEMQMMFAEIRAAG